MTTSERPWTTQESKDVVWQFLCSQSLLSVARLKNLICTLLLVAKALRQLAYVNTLISCILDLSIDLTTGNGNPICDNLTIFSWGQPCKGIWMWPTKRWTFLLFKLWLSSNNVGWLGSYPQLPFGVHGRQNPENHERNIFHAQFRIITSLR